MKGQELVVLEMMAKEAVLSVRLQLTPSMFDKEHKVQKLVG